MLQCGLVNVLNVEIHRMVKKICRRWFLELRNDGTNESTITELVNLIGASEEGIYRGKTDKDGVAHDVIEVNHSFVSRMQNGSHKFRLLFNVFVQDDGEDEMDLWLFGATQGVSRKRRVVRVARRLVGLAKKIPIPLIRRDS